MKLSVLMITYNHEKFIAQALDSVLMQRVNFDYEIVIGEDRSTDATREIVLAYRDLHPDRIRLLLPEENLGMHRNFVETYRACRGQYVAMLEGDDYWTDSEKLQKQVEFLDRNPGCSICFHPVEVIGAGNHGTSSVFPANFTREVSTLEDLVVENFIPNCSAVFRRGLVGEIPGWFYTLRQGDWPFHVLNALHGDIGCLGEVMAVYRVHEGGVWSRESLPLRLEAIVKAYCAINEHLEHRYDHLIRPQIAGCWYRIAECREAAGEVVEARRIFWKSLRCALPTLSAPRYAALAVKLYAPALYRMVVGNADGAGHV